MEIIKPLLTIAIPTYNRCEYLKICLNSICSQKNVNFNEIELMVSDNNSDDNTDLLVKEFIKNGLNIRYIKNEKNIGPDNNFIQCFNLAKGKYFWLIGDDDIVIEGALEKIINSLKGDEEYGLIFLNSYPFLNDYLKEKPNFNKDGFIVFDSHISFISKFHYFLTFISTVIVNKNIAIKDIDIENMRDTNLIQLSWTFNALFKSSKNAFIERYCIAAKSGSTGGYKLCAVFGHNLQKAFDIYIRRGVNPQYFEVIKKKMLISFFPANIIRAKKKLFKGEKENFFKMLYPLYKNYLYFWLFTLPAIVFPLWLSYRIYIFFNLLRKFKRSLYF